MSSIFYTTGDAVNIRTSISYNELTIPLFESLHSGIERSKLLTEPIMRG